MQKYVNEDVCDGAQLVARELELLIASQFMQIKTCIPGIIAARLPEHLMLRLRMDIDKFPHQHIKSTITSEKPEHRVLKRHCRLCYFVSFE